MTWHDSELTRQVCGDLMGLALYQRLDERNHMLFEEALSAASRDEGFKATVYAMNTLLIHKGIYTQEEFQAAFVEWVQKEHWLRSGPAKRNDANFVSA
jgi:hypothetical protein